MAVAQRTPEWIAARQMGIGSSDIPVLAGESPYRSPYSLWAEKTGQIMPEPDEAQAELFEIGHLMEPVLLTIYERRTGRHPRRARMMRTHPDLPWAHASLDAVAPVRRVVEAKWTTSQRWGDEGVPDDVLLQVQWQLFVVGWQVADVVALAGRRARVVEVPRDDGLIDRLVALATDFWQGVEHRVPPPVDGSEATRQTLVALHPAATAPALSPTPELVSLVDRYVEAKAVTRAAADDESTIGNALRAVIGEADGIAGLVTYRQSADVTRVNWPAVAAAYRQLLEGSGADLDALEAIHSVTSQGPRSLRLSKGVTS